MLNVSILAFICQYLSSMKKRRARLIEFRQLNSAALEDMGLFEFKRQELINRSFKSSKPFGF